MAKTIKISLPINGQKVRTIEELQDNFVIDELIELYKQKILHKWLKSRGYEQELQQIEKIDSTDSKKLIIALAQVFDVNVDENELELLVSSINYQAPKKASSAKKVAASPKQEIDSYSYSSGFDLKRKMEEYQSEIDRLEKLGQDVLTECEEKKLKDVYGEQEVQSWEKLKSEMSIFCQEFAPVLNFTLYAVSRRFTDNSPAAWCVLAAQRRWWQNADSDGVNLYMPSLFIKEAYKPVKIQDPYHKFFKEIKRVEGEPWTILEERGKTCLVKNYGESISTDFRAIENDDGFRWERIWNDFLLSDGLKVKQDDHPKTAIYLVI